jgi:hypothetical protein
LLALGFGKSIGNMLDPRPLSHALISFVLVIFSALTLRRCRPTPISDPPLFVPS